MTTNPSVVVVGAGAIGCACAYHLAKAGCSVTVVERGQLCQEASWASAGMIAQALPGDDPLDQLHALGAKTFRDLAEEISELTGVDASYRMNGSLRLCTDVTEWPVWESICRALRARGVPCELLSAADVVALEPVVSAEIAGGLLSPEDGQVDPRQYTHVLALAAMQLGTRFHFGSPVVGLRREGNRITGVDTPLASHAADVVVVATGAWSEGVGKLLGIRLPMQPARGQILKLHATPPLLKRTVHCGEIYLTARTDGTVLIGSTVEFVGFDKRVTVAGAHFLLERALQTAPGLGDAALVDQWAGFRPYPQRERPYLGPVAGLEGVFLATGHFTTGISPSGITGQLVAEWVTTGKTSIPLEPFAV